jgi:hypothetical protein
VAVQNSGFCSGNERENGDNETVLFVIEKQFPLNETAVVKTQFTILITEFDPQVEDEEPMSFKLFLKIQNEISIPVPRV